MKELKAEERQSLIKAKEEKIKELKKELADLKGATTFSVYTTETMLYAIRCTAGNSHIEIREAEYLMPQEWNGIKELGKGLFSAKHPGRRYCIKDMTEDEKKIAARMADEMIVIWNKYVKAVYGGDKK